MGVIRMHSIESNKVKKDHMKIIHHQRRSLLCVALGLSVITSPRRSNSELVSELLEKSASRKDLNDKKRLATSYANFARSRTVTDNTCRFPDNFIGCQNAAELGNVKFLTDDMKIECEGKEGNCASKSRAQLMFHRNARIEHVEYSAIYGLSMRTREWWQKKWSYSKLFRSEGLIEAY